MSYKDKYIKYKNKYLSLKSELDNKNNTQKGGTKLDLLNDLTETPSFDSAYGRKLNLDTNMYKEILKTGSIDNLFISNHKGGNNSEISSASISNALSQSEFNENSVSLFTGTEKSSSSESSSSESSSSRSSSSESSSSESLSSSSLKGLATTESSISSLN